MGLVSQVAGVEHVGTGRDLLGGTEGGLLKVEGRTRMEKKIAPRYLGGDKKVEGPGKVF